MGLGRCTVEIRAEELNLCVSTYATQANEVVIVSPYIKNETIKWIFSLINSEAKVLVLTKANLQDFIFGASDIESWQEIWKIGGRLFIEQNLHAKYYRFDNVVLIGSANLTEKGLNRYKDPNLELMCVIDYSKDIAKIEEKIFSNKIEIEEDQFRELKEIVDNYKAKQVINDLDLQIKKLTKLYELKFKEVTLPDRWCFKTKNPSNLWKSYEKPSDLDQISLDYAAHDLSVMDILPWDGMLKEEFYSLIAGRLRNWGLVKKLNNFFENNETKDRPHLSYGFIKKNLGLKGDTRENAYVGTVNAFFDWMIEFFPEVYFEPEKKHSRLLGRRSEPVYCKCSVRRFDSGS